MKRCFNRFQVWWPALLLKFEMTIKLISINLLFIIVIQTLSIKCVLLIGLKVAKVSDFSHLGFPIVYTIVLKI